MLVKKLSIFIVTILAVSHIEGIEIHKHNRSKDLEIIVPKFVTQPKIDGDLTDKCWRKAARVSNFTEFQPREGEKPEVNTEVVLGYDSENLYIGFICYESEASEIRGTFTNRDEFANDDFVWVVIDTYGDLQTAYEFGINPCGVQFDLYRTGNQENSNFDTCWESEAKVSDNGWTAEFRIPFKALKFPKKDKSHWRINFIRTRPRESQYVYSWAAISRDDPNILAQTGHLWINERISTGRNIEFLPYITGAQTGALTNVVDPTSFHNDRGRGNIGLSAKYGISSDLTLDLALNPDYSQIESDVTQIDVNTTFALFYPEKRPFFLEGKGIFETPIDAVYTRSINDPLLAAKFTGKIGRTSIGYVIARDQHTPWVIPFEEYSFKFSSDKRSLSNILRVKQDILKDSYIGASITDRELSDAFNRVIGIDGNIRVKTIYNFSFQTLGSWTKEPDDSTLFAGYPGLTFGKNYSGAFDGEGFSGAAYRLALNRSARYWNFTVYHENLSPTFRADNGFINQNNYKRSYAWTGLTFWPNKWMVEQIGPGISANVTYNYKGILKNRWISPSIWVSFKKQTSLSVYYSLSSEYFGGKRFDGLWRYSNNVSTSFSKRFLGGIYLSFGKTINYSALDFGYDRSFRIFGEIKPTDKLRTELMFNRYWLWEKGTGRELYDVHVLYNKTTYQFSKHLSVRLITQYYSRTGQVEIDPLISYELNPFTVFYLGSNHDFDKFDEPYGMRESYHQIFVKFQYLIRSTPEDIFGKVKIWKAR